MTDPTPTLRALARDTTLGLFGLRDLGPENTLHEEEWDRRLSIIETALVKVQALQREADAQIAEDAVFVHGKELVRLHEEIASLRAAHVSLVQEMETHLQHKEGCPERNIRQTPPFCTCGLLALLRRSAAPHQENTDVEV